MRKGIPIVIILALAITAAAQQSEPSTAAGWFELGVHRHEARDYRGALEAFDKAQALGYLPRPALRLRMLRAYAQAGETDKAFALLESMAANGFPTTQALNAENDLIPLRSDPRWATLTATLNRNAHPCRNAPEFRQFDYWLGEWDVEIGGQRLAQSSVNVILDDCVIFENYTDSRGYAGKSFSLWDANTQKWEQRYVDTGGALHHWTGALEEGVMVFYWKYQQNGHGVTQRMKYVKESPDQVRQVIDLSTDDGKTWTPNYNGLYIRRK